MIHLGDFPASHTAVCIPFDSFAAATGAPSAVTNFAAADIQIYKDGGTTQRSSASGITVTTSFDTQTGLQMIVIDLSDNTDSGFYAAGHEYQVAVADITVDAQTLRFWAATFSIERANGVLAKLISGAAKVDVTKWLTGTIPAVNVTGVPLVDAKYLLGTIFATPATAGIIDANVKNIDNDAASASGTVTFPNATLASTTNITAATGIDVTKWNGTTVTTPKTAGTPVVDWVPSGWRSNTAAAGAAGTITLDASASATNDFYKYTLIQILSGTGAGQARLCTGYTAASKVATVVPNWTTNPSSDSVFATMPLALADVEAWLAAAAPANTGDAYARLGAPAGASVSADVAAVKSDSAAIKAKTDNLPAAPASTTNITGGTITTVTNLTNAPTAGDFTSTMKTSLNAATPAVTVSDKTGFSLSAAGVQAIWDALTSALTTVGSIGKRLVDNLTGDIYARIGAPVGASISADIAAVQSDTDNIQTRIPAALTTDGNIKADALKVSGVDNVAQSGDSFAELEAGLIVSLTAAYNAAKTAASQSSVNAIQLDITAIAANLAAVLDDTGTSGVLLTAAERNAIADALLARTIGTESYAAAGAVPSVKQALFMVLQNIQEFVVQGTTLTVRKLDGTTTAMTFTLDDADDPTSRTRAT